MSVLRVVERPYTDSRRTDASVSTAPIFRTRLLGFSGIECRYLLVVEHAENENLIADPAGCGLAIIAHGELLEWCKLGSKRGVAWVGLVGPIAE